MNLSFTAVYTFLCAWFFGQPIQEVVPPPLDAQTKQIFHAILHDHRPEFDLLVSNIADKRTVLPDGTTPLTFAIEQKQFYCCTELIKERFLASAQDLTQARLMHTLESDPVKKQDAEICINFLEQYLQELKLIPKISDVKRGKDDQEKIDKTFEQIIQEPDYLLIQATMNNNVAAMNALILLQHANPDTCINYSTPLSIAIAQGHEEAIACLIKHKVTITPFDEQKALVYLEVVNNQSDEVSSDPETLHQREQKYLQVERTLRIYKKIAEHLAQAATPQRAKTPEATLMPTPAPRLYRTSHADRIRQLRQNMTPEPRILPKPQPTITPPNSPKKNIELPPLQKRERKP